jgi:hypothetical protein
VRKALGFLDSGPGGSLEKHDKGTNGKVHNEAKAEAKTIAKERKREKGDHERAVSISNVSFAHILTRRGSLSLSN